MGDITNPAEVTFNLNRVFLLGMYEILGEAEARRILEQSGLAVLDQPEAIDQPGSILEHASQLLYTLENSYGWLGGQGLAVLIGRSMFKHVLQGAGAGLGLADLAFRLLPLARKRLTVLQNLAQALNNTGAFTINIKDEEDCLLWIIERCPLCRERSTQAPACALVSGFLQEALYWLSGGKNYLVEETGCIAAGSQACTFRCDKQPWE